MELQSPWKNLEQPISVAPHGVCKTELGDFDAPSSEHCCCAVKLNPFEYVSNGVVTDCIKLHSSKFYQQCPSGKGSIAGKDIDECELFGAKNICPGGSCHNQLMGFACTCQQDGYYWEQGKRLYYEL